MGAKQMQGFVIITATVHRYSSIFDRATSNDFTNTCTISETDKIHDLSNSISTSLVYLDLYFLSLDSP